jgi:hypothetical protein
MTDVKEKRICIRLGKTAVKTHKMLKEVYVDTALGLTLTYELFKGLKKCWMWVDNDERSWTF